MNISLSPSLLEFKPPFDTSNTEILTITNDSKETAAFKVKTTAPKLYCVRPNAGLIQPGESIEVSIIMLGLKETVTADFKCNDKFLIVALPCPLDLGDKTVSESWTEIESKFKSESISKKIKVKYVVEELESIAQEPTIVVPSPDEKAAAVSSVSEKQNEKTLSEKLDEVSPEDKSKIDALNEKLDSTASTPTTKAVSPTQKSSSSSMTTLILIAFIVMIISWLLF